MFPPDGRTAALQRLCNPVVGRGVFLIQIEVAAALIIGVPTLMISFAILVLKIVEVARSK